MTGTCSITRLECSRLVLQRWQEVSERIIERKYIHTIIRKLVVLAKRNKKMIWEARNFKQGRHSTKNVTMLLAQAH